MMRAKRRFSQNFLINTGVIQKIIDAVNPHPNETILEIGPGPGILTRPLLERGARVVAVDADREMIAALREEFAGNERLTLVQSDILQYAWQEIPPTPRIKVVGNIPYHISSPILFWLAAHRDRIASAVITMQREVALRLVATAGTKDYGALTIGMGAVAHSERLFDIRPGSFRPAPSVTSSTVRVTFPDPPPYHIPDPMRFRAVVRTAFSKRRKMLRGIFPEAVLTAAGIDSTRRPETLNVEEFARLALVSSGIREARHHRTGLL